MTIKASDPNSIKPLLKELYIPPTDSHKGQNGKLLIIGGSKLFHAASIWAAEMASHMVDMVHYSSIKENNEILSSIKKKFRNGIVIPRAAIEEYVKEDDAVLVGPGMLRTEKKMVPTEDYNMKKIEDLEEIEHEGIQTYYLTKFLLSKFPEKKFILDAGSLQMMDPQWLAKRKAKAIVVPHQKEFMTLFGIDVSKVNLEEKKKIVRETASEYNCVVLFKGPTDIISDGNETHLVEGGNAGLTKGGSGDVLAALTASFNTKNNGLLSAVLASYLVKSAAEELFFQSGYWYNTSIVIQTIPEILFELYKNARNV